jgi:uncharacterized protein YndB with AHSA1/START domain
MNAATIAPASDRELVLTRILNAPREKLFKCAQQLEALAAKI